MLLAVVGSSSISSTRIDNSPRFDAESVSSLNGLEAVINHSMSEGKRLILCNALEFLGIVAQESQIVASDSDGAPWIAHSASHDGHA